MPTAKKPNKRRYDALWALGAFIALALGASAAATHSLTFGSGLTQLNLSTVFVAILVVYVGAAFKVVGPDELAGTFFYGMPLAEIKPGGHLVWPGLMQMVKVSALIQQYQEPGEPEKIFHGDRKEQELPEGMVWPIVVTTGGRKKRKGAAEEEQSEDNLGTRMTLLLSFYWRFQINNIFAFIANYGSVEELRKQVRDTGEVELAEIAAGNTPATMIKNLEKINNKFVDRIKVLFRKAGVDFKDAQMLSPDLPHRVSKALADVTEARLEATAAISKKEASIRDAEAKATATELDLLAKAKGRKADLDAEAKGLKAKLKALGVSGEALLTAEAVEKLAEGGNVILAGAEGGAKDLLGMVLGAQGALTKTKKPAQPSAES